MAALISAAGNCRELSSRPQTQRPPSTVSPSSACAPCLWCREPSTRFAGRTGSHLGSEALIQPTTWSGFRRYAVRGVARPGAADRRVEARYAWSVASPTASIEPITAVEVLAYPERVAQLPPRMRGLACAARTVA